MIFQRIYEPDPADGVILLKARKGSVELKFGVVYTKVPSGSNTLCAGSITGCN